MPLHPLDDINLQHSNDCHHRNLSGACPRNCQNLLKGKQLLLSKLFLEWEEQLPAPRSHAKSSGYEMAKILGDAIFVCLFT